MNKTIKSLIAIFLLTIGVVSMAQDIQIYTTNNSSGKITPQSIEKTFKDAGFYITTNNNMNRAFDSKYKT